MGEEGNAGINKGNDIFAGLQEEGEKEEEKERELKERDGGRGGKIG